MADYGNEWIEPPRTGAISVALLFGLGAVVLAVMLAPAAEHLLDRQIGHDRMTTGSIDRQPVYTVRRSVLQPTPEAICIIRSNGSRSGQC